MLTLAVGGASSGKSAWAEELILRSPHGPRIYIAAMEPAGGEAMARIRRHRAMRAGKGFETVECPLGLSALRVPPGCAALLEDLGNLCANELYSPRGSGEGAEEAVLSGVAHLRRLCGELVVVSNEVFSGGMDYQGDTLRYLRLLARVNRRLAAQADRVCEVVCGIPVYHKGG